MQLKAISILCVLLAAQVFAVRDVSGISQRALKLVTASFGSSASGDSPDAMASSSLSLSVISDGPGSVSVIADATASAETEIRDAVANIVATAISQVEGGEVATAIVAVEVEAIAEAIATAIANTAIDIVSDAESASVCVFASADASATARAVATIIVEVLAEASSDINFASASAAIDAIVDATASAYASAQSQACGINGFTASTYINIFAQAVAEPFIEIFALAFALATPNAAIADIVVIAVADVLQVLTVTGETASAVVGNANAISDGDAGADVSPGR